MEIKGFTTNSFIDWTGKISSILFLPFCNFRCPFCQNSDLVLCSNDLETISQEDIISYLNNKTKWIDGVVITGGEPTLHSDLKAFIQNIKELNLLIKLDTNGYKPDIIRDLLEHNLIDYLAMDIKTELTSSSYSKAVGIDVDINKLEESIDLIMSGFLHYEFRTTLVPGIVGREELINIARKISNAARWTWQEFKPQNTLDPEYLKLKSYNLKDVKNWEQEVKPIMKNLVTYV